MDKLQDKLVAAQSALYDSLNVTVQNVTISEAYRIGSRIQRAIKHISETLDTAERIRNANR